MENVAKGTLRVVTFFFFSSEMFHKLAGHRSHREMPSRLKDIYLLVNGRQTLFSQHFLETRERRNIYRAINNLSGLTGKRNKTVFITYLQFLLIFWIFLRAFHFSP